MLNIDRLVNPEVKANFMKGFPILFTALSKSGARFTYRRLNRGKYEKSGIEWAWYGVLVSNNNESVSAYAFIGTLFKRPDGTIWFKWSSGSGVGMHKDAPSVKGFNWLTEMVQDGKVNSLNQVEIYQANQCLFCGKTLTTPSSVVDGVGPVCKTKM